MNNSRRFMKIISSAVVLGLVFSVAVALALPRPEIYPEPSSDNNVAAENPSVCITPTNTCVTVPVVSTASTRHHRAVSA